MLYSSQSQFENVYSTTMPNNNDISDDEKAFFRESMRDVKPLRPTIKREQKPPSKPIRTRKQTNIPTPSPLNHYLSNYYHETVQANTVLAYCRHGIPKKRLYDVKSGQIDYEARLDLHGLNLDDARDALCHFLEKQYVLNKRCLLIIHGKGGRHGEAPILKNLVNHWLPQLPDVLAFHSALPKHGGTGAVYVLLRRRRGGDIEEL